MKGAGLALAGMAATGGRTQDRPPPDLGRKFAADGRVLPFKGNTIICHLPQQGEYSAPFDALLDIYRALPAERWAAKMAALPPSSYHMTIFGGANDKERRAPLWPVALPTDMPMADCDRIFEERLRSFRLGPDAAPYHMRIDPAEPPTDETPLTVRLLPADAETQIRLGRLRDRLAVATGIREPGHDHYRFHITLGYLFASLTPAEDAAWRRALAAWRVMLAGKAPVITLGNPEFCLLNDMFAFKRQFYLS